MAHSSSGGCAALAVLAALAAIASPASSRGGARGRALGGVVDLDAPHVVPDGAMLTIEPGTRVRGAGSIVVLGTLVAAGRPEAPVVFEVPVEIAGTTASSSRIEEAQFFGVAANGPRLLTVIQAAAPLVRSSRFENGTKALCVGSGASPRVESNFFLFNGFSLYDDATAPSRTDDPEAARGPGATGGCWRLAASGLACRGWGGAAAVEVTTRAAPRFHGNAFVANRAGILVLPGAMPIIANNSFRENDVGVEIIYNAGEAVDCSTAPAIRLDGNEYRAHGAAAFEPSRSPGVEAGVRVLGDFSGETTPTPETARIQLANESFVGNAIGLFVEGWRPGVVVHATRFHGNAIGLRVFHGSATVRSSVFSDSKAWNVQAFGTPFSPSPKSAFSRTSARTRGQSRWT